MYDHRALMTVEAETLLRLVDGFEQVFEFDRLVLGRVDAQREQELLASDPLGNRVNLVERAFEIVDTKPRSCATST
jgi:hypothetical protein